MDIYLLVVFFFKQKTAYEMRISDWSSDVCSSDLLEGTGAKFDTLNRVDMTQAERLYAPAYKAGMLIQPEKDYKKAGLMRGETYTGKQALPGNILIVTGADGNPIQFNPRQVTKLSVYKHERPELAMGDLVRITRNDPALDLTNGDRMRVV